MASFLKPALKYFCVVAVALSFGYSVWLIPHGSGKKKESVSITTPIDAKDEAGRYLQQASENFFYHEFDEAIENYGKAIIAFEKERKFEKAANIYESLGDLYKFRTRFKDAEEQYILAMKYHNKINNPLGEAKAMNRAGDLFMDRGEHIPAKAWYQKGVELVQDLPPHQIQAILYESLGHIYWKTEENIPEAIAWYTRARDSFSALENQLGYDHMSEALNKLRGGENLNTH